MKYILTHMLTYMHIYIRTYVSKFINTVPNNMTYKLYGNNPRLFGANFYRWRVQCG